MKFVIGIACLMMAACVSGSPRPAPPIHDSEESYAWYCRTPKCPTSHDVNLYFPRDCLQYVKCTKGVAQILPCPADTQFNEAAATCTDPATAKCLQCWQKDPPATGAPMD